MASSRVRLRSRIGDAAPGAAAVGRSPCISADACDPDGGISPVRRMQEGLSDRLAQPPCDDAAGKWSPRASLLFIIGSCGAFWALAITAAALLTRR